MTDWIERKYKDQYKDSAKASGIRYQFYDYDNVFDKSYLFC